MDVAQLLIGNGVDVNAESTSGGATPLFDAVRHGKEEMTKLLIAHGANVNAYDLYGTPLHIAAAEGHRVLVELIIAAGADINARATRWYNPGTPLDWAVEAGQVEIADLLRKHGAMSAKP